MKTLMRTCIVLLAAWQFVAGNMTTRAQSAQQTADQTKTESNANRPAEKKITEGAAATKKNNPNSSSSSDASIEASPGGASANARSSAANPKTSPARNAGMVWVNTESGVYHRPGTRWYGRTKQGKYMTEADAVKAGYKASVRN